jgi:high-affinity iron transporter
MTGTTIHVVQGLGWLPTTTTPFAVPLWASRWLGIYGTWEGIAAQVGALAIVLGSYVAAREIQVRRPRRRALADQHPARSAVATPPAAPAS